MDGGEGGERLESVRRDIANVRSQLWKSGPLLITIYLNFPSIVRRYIHPFPVGSLPDISISMRFRGRGGRPGGDCLPGQFVEPFHRVTPTFDSDAETRIETAGMREGGGGKKKELRNIANGTEGGEGK